ncbi:hypothetical protein BTM25_11530 [Actinomadura rubteroloni]|uniref:Uncharacterized protein n=1 Tax=Actinomadura rubteroloni TaxID=1926885 RepID=A0A2P4UNX2_9ACTN|nr:hypothetical protein [Actinomadura rubteroloni]POM26747.1 hypothetical protein BTM25_11530 [Actinomadura rubteroloni]
MLIASKLVSWYGHPNHKIISVANALTGLVKAFELHADANPRDAFDLRIHANEVRGLRDDLLEATGQSGATLNEWRGADEWTAAIAHFTQGNRQWPARPSRDPLLTLAEAPPIEE